MEEFEMEVGAKSDNLIIRFSNLKSWSSSRGVVKTGGILWSPANPPQQDFDLIEENQINRHMPLI